MDTRVMCGEVADLEVDERRSGTIAFFNFDRLKQDGLTLKLATDSGTGAMIGTKLSRFRYMEAGKVLLEHLPNCTRSIIFVKDDDEAPFRTLVSAGLIAAHLCDCQVIRLSLRRSDSKFPHVESSVESVIKELSEGWATFRQYCSVLTGASDEPFEQILIAAGNSMETMTSIQSAIEEGLFAC